ncbi:hypothetical protein DSCW_04070 [Desulfosarcina widdelii]|uniref:Uncharacterized protein n=1 Tax=Desulfosarcina widdelii TaxID=947919 RepID=A0A5K7YXC7_9BACT|nr:hypothetical protein [Desulfosarcina widdelii]BBO72990.1 hypothetical protein DSCW_04070 [Desulfosarcina widdelii]
MYLKSLIIIMKEKLKIYDGKYMSNILKILAISVILNIPVTALSSPSISSVEGTVKDGSRIFITGNDFGANGPNIFLFDDFSGGENGEVFPDKSAIIGTWDLKRGKVWTDNLLSKNQGSRHTGLDGGMQNRILFGSVQEEIFISSIAYVPDGYRFPGAATENALDSNPNIKHAWLFYTADGYSVDNDPDMWMPGVDTGGNWQTLMSNDTRSPRQGWRSGSAEQQWAWNEPVRWSFWFKGNGTTASGSREYHGAVSSSGHTFYENHNVAWFDTSDHAYGFDRMTIPGYLSRDSYPTYNYVIDDVYVAVGPNAAARVEIGNNAKYTNCTKLAIMTPTSWSDNKIEAVVREGMIDTNDTLYLYVIDNNNVCSDGYPISISTQDDDLDPPQNLKVID